RCSQASTSGGSAWTPDPRVRARAGTIPSSLDVSPRLEPRGADLQEDCDGEDQVGDEADLAYVEVEARGHEEVVADAPRTGGRAHGDRVGEVYLESKEGPGDERADRARDYGLADYLRPVGPRGLERLHHVASDLLEGLGIGLEQVAEGV